MNKIILDGGSNREPYGKPFIATPAVNTKMVNGSARDLFPPICLVKIWFIPREKRAFAPSVWMSAIQPKRLKTISLLSLTNCPLNLI